MSKRIIKAMRSGNENKAGWIRFQRSFRYAAYQERELDHKLPGSLMQKWLAAKREQS